MLEKAPVVVGPSRAATEQAMAMGAVGPQLSLRRFGWSDYQNFSDLAMPPSQLCVGSASIGKIAIDCKYRWRESHWGFLEDNSHKRPAAILYMDMTFNQPAGYRLHSASVFITLSDIGDGQDDTKGVKEDDDGHIYGRRGRYGSIPQRVANLKRTERKSRASSREKNLASEYSVQMTTHYGPKILGSTPVIREKTKTKSRTPFVEGWGVGFGGVGVTEETMQEEVGQWTFKGTVARPKDGYGLRTLEWELAETPFDRARAHNNTYHTAFTFEHSQRAVLMRVEIQGRLKATRHQLKHKMLRFSTKSGSKNDSTVTRIHLSPDQPFNTRLDRIARDLHKEMTAKNLRSAMTIMPDSLPVDFAHLTKTSPRSSSPVSVPMEDSADDTAPTIAKLLEPLQQAIEAQQPQLLGRLDHLHPADMVGYTSSHQDTNVVPGASDEADTTCPRNDLSKNPSGSQRPGAFNEAIQLLAQIPVVALFLKLLLQAFAIQSLPLEEVKAAKKQPAIAFGDASVGPYGQKWDRSSIGRVESLKSGVTVDIVNGKPLGVGFPKGGGERSWAW